jgi:hypothetical protein
MSLIQDVVSKHQNLLVTIGESGLNALYKNDFEYYMVALELVTSDNFTVDYFCFPVSPSSISQEEPELTNIKKTASGIVSLTTPSFVPKTIQMRGNFGRRFKILLKNNSSVNFSAFKFSGSVTKDQIMNDVNILKQAAFDPSIKSGYGAIRYLKSILDKSTGIDQNNQSFKLFFYNPILGDNYLVEKISFEISESMESNRIPGYNLILRAIAPLDSMSSVDSKKSMVKVLASNLLQKGANSIANSIRRGLR